MNYVDENDLGVRVLYNNPALVGALRVTFGAE